MRFQLARGAIDGKRLVGMVLRHLERPVSIIGPVEPALDSMHAGQHGVDLRRIRILAQGIFEALAGLAIGIGTHRAE